MRRHPAVVIVLGVLTAVQAGTGLWRIFIMYQEGLRAGARPFEFSTGLLEEIGLSLFLAVVAWWWLPRGRGTWSGWAVHFLVMGWLLAIGQLVWVLLLGFFEHGVSWAILLLLFALGTVLRARKTVAAQPSQGNASRFHPALVGGLIFWLLQLPHLFLPYHWTDTKDTWACRAAAFDRTGGLVGIFDCLDPGRPPLHSIMLWLGHTNTTIEGRLLPFLLVGAFGLVFFRGLKRVAPTLAPWGALWFFMTVRVYQGAVSSYADVPVMLAIALAIFLVTDEQLVASRWRAVAFALIAGAAAALIKRDGGALIVVATAVLWWFIPRRRDPRLYAALAGAAIGFALWSVRPEHLATPSVFDVRIGQVEAPSLPIRLVSQEGVPDITPDTARATVQTYLTMFYGMQGQMLSHYGFSMFIPLWIILAVWFWRRHEHLSPEARIYTWIAVLGWLAIVGMYVVHVSTGHPYRGSLRVIRTAFGRHLVHMFVFALLSAAAMAEILVARARARSG
jgi:hypothetical protein